MVSWNVGSNLLMQEARNLLIIVMNNNKQRNIYFVYNLWENIVVSFFKIIRNLL